MRKRYLPLPCGLMVTLAGAALFCGTPFCATPGLRAADLKYPLTVGEYIDGGALNQNSVYTSKIKLTINSGANTTVTRGLIQLPALPSIPAADIASVKLWLDLTWDNESNPYARGATLYPLLQSFNAGAASWLKSDTSTSTLWSTAGGTYDSAKPVVWTPGSGIPTSVNTNVWCSWDLTTLWNDADLFTNGALLMFDLAEAQPASGFYTKQFSNATSGPYQGYVEVTTVPEPSAWALLPAAAGALAMASRRRRAAARGE